MSDAALLAELNAQVWTPFREAYGRLDAPAFLALHHPGLVRAGGPAKEILGLAEYAEQTTGWFEHVRAQGDALAIELRFEERIARAGLASERGVFRITVTLADGTTRHLYGRFHTYARQVDGRWLITNDHDCQDRADAATFEAAHAADDLAPFTAVPAT